MDVWMSWKFLALRFRFFKVVAAEFFMRKKMYEEDTK